jgi:hypothetical protein
MLRGRARIFHFWAASYGEENPGNTLLGDLIARFQRDGALDEVTIACATRDDFPWMNDARLKHLLASGLYLRGAGLVAPHIIRCICGTHPLASRAHARFSES